MYAVAIMDAAGRMGFEESGQGVRVVPEQPEGCILGHWVRKLKGIPSS